MVQEDAALSIAWDDGFEEDRWWEEGAKLRSLPGSLGGNTRMNDLCDSRVARRCIGDRLGKCAAATCGGDQEWLNRGRFRTVFVQAHIGTKEPRQCEQLLERLRQVFQINNQLGTGSRDQSRFRDGSVQWMVAELDPGCRLDCYF